MLQRNDHSITETHPIHVAGIVVSWDKEDVETVIGGEVQGCVRERNKEIEDMAQ